MKKYLIQAYETTTTFYDLEILAESREKAMEVAKDDFFDYDPQEIESRQDHFEIQNVSEMTEDAV